MLPEKMVYPNFVRGVAGLPAKRLRELASQAGVTTKPKQPAEEIAESLQRKLEHGTDVWSYIDAADVEPIGLALRPRAARQVEEQRVARRVVEAVVQQEAVVRRRRAREKLKTSEPRPRRRAMRVPVKHKTGKWPELATFARWQKADRRAVAKALAKALKGFTAGLTGEHELPRLRHKALGLDLIAIPGGEFTMGLAPKEVRELDKAVDDEETFNEVDIIKRQARPSRAVTVTPFLIAAAPLTRAQLGALDADVHDEMPAGIARVFGPEAARAVRHANGRLPSEAEWEYVARTGGTRTWLSGDEPHRAWCERVASGEPEIHPFEITGLGWGEWVDDSWHNDYKNAPKVSAAWQPLTFPELRRGGALAIWPWRGVGGEFITCHAAARNRTLDGLASVRLAMDLPLRTPA